ncbi:M12 family metallopeptidase [Sorangium sp. KYC3313]|uniref:M12 family metallopeptidase n=1 Tax=Sorangium sp. KYC3313 TaxID=3449740 RepID=UPI003F8B2405
MTSKTETARRACIDRVIPFEFDREARAIALAENPDNAPEPNAGTAEKMAMVKRKLWRPGRRLRVRFLDGSSFLREKVEQYVAELTRHANLDFEFGNDPRAEIRISFAFDPGNSWSAIGTDCLVDRYFPRHQPTMNFGWFDESTDEQEFSRVIVHEFGHAIGCIHEHQIPGGIKWNEQAVIEYFSGSPNFWDEQTIRFNILDRYSQRQINGTKFDPDSIMLYDFPASLTTDGVGTHSNTRLSRTDIDFIRQMYPGRA